MLTQVINGDHKRDLHVALLAAEFVISVVIIFKVQYTEIDWKAYMQEVQGFEDGERDYTKIEGDTGPLVYPAGFLYIFFVLKHLTQNGTHILGAQFIFVIFYMITLICVFGLQYHDRALPAVASTVLILSKRIHSIFLLRMFNDCVAVMFGYVAFYLLILNKWRVGSFMYSLAVSVKMNMLLYAPGLLLVLLVGVGFRETFICLAICAVTQLVLGLPFLTTYPVQYLGKAFELSRVFTYKWTVNLKFLPEEVFVSKPLSLLLLGLTVATLVLFAVKWIKEIRRQIAKIPCERPSDMPPITSMFGVGDLSTRFVLLALYTSNFIGVVFARTLHYQFYCWYFHTLPVLLWHCLSLHPLVKVALLGAIELSFNVYPATWWSSALLQVCHLTILVALYLAPVPLVTAGHEDAIRTIKEERREERKLARSHKKAE